jgi:class 3 adenylate cyclase
VIPRTLVACFKPEVVGRPRWRADYLRQGLCRAKWLGMAALLVWFVQGAAIPRMQAAIYAPAAQSLGMTPQAVIYLSLAVGFLGALWMLGSGRDPIGIGRARGLALLGAVSAVMAEALLFGFSHFSMERSAAADLAFLIVLAVFPLGLWESLLTAAVGLVAIVVAAALSGLAVDFERYVYLLHFASFALLGIVVNRWYRGVFRTSWYDRIRLERRTRQLESQKRQIELQKDEALRQRAEIAQQRVALLHALSSALTAPVADAYERAREFPTELRTVCVIACDAVGFSETCRKLQPERIVMELEAFFRAFDSACFDLRIEPLRAQGDSRIAIAGLWPDANRGLHQETISAVLAMLRFRRSLPALDMARDPGVRHVLWPARIGISIGPASCGVIDTGERHSASITGRLWFDVWGDTVNLAARLQQAAEPNQILVREAVLWETCGLFDHGPIGPVQVKTTIVNDATEVLGIREPYRDAQGNPNDAFWEVFRRPFVQPVKPNPAGTVGSVPSIGT